MRTLIRNATIVTADWLGIADVLIDGERISRVGTAIASRNLRAEVRV